MFGITGSPTLRITRMNSRHLACLAGAALMTACASFEPLAIPVGDPLDPRPRATVVASSEMRLGFSRTGAFGQSVHVHLESLDGVAVPSGRPCRFEVIPGRHVAIYQLQASAPFSGGRAFGPQRIAFETTAGRTYVILSAGPLPPQAHPPPWVWVHEVETGRTLAGQAPPGFRQAVQLVADRSHADCKEL